MWCRLPTAQCFQKYFEETIEKFAALGKQICVLGDFNINLLKVQSSNHSHDFLLTLQSYLIPTVDKPTRVRSTSATLIDNIFSQFCIMSSIADQLKENRKVHDFSKFSSPSSVADLVQVDCDGREAQKKGQSIVFLWTADKLRGNQNT